MPLDFAVFYLRNRTQQQTVLFGIAEDKFPEFLERLLGKEFAAAEIAAGTPLDFLHTAIVDPILAAWGFVVLQKDKGGGGGKNGSTPGSTSGPGAN